MREWEGSIEDLPSPPLAARPVTIILLGKNDRTAASSAKEGRSEKVFILNELELEIWTCFPDFLVCCLKRVERWTTKPQNNDI